MIIAYKCPMNLGNLLSHQDLATGPLSCHTYMIRDLGGPVCLVCVLSVCVLSVCVLSALSVLSVCVFSVCVFRVCVCLVCVCVCVCVLSVCVCMYIQIGYSTHAIHATCTSHVILFVIPRFTPKSTPNTL